MRVPRSAPLTHPNSLAKILSNATKLMRRQFPIHGF